LDLQPLTGLTNLEGLTLRGNGLQELDVTPLALSANLRYLSFSPDVVIIADPLLQHYGPKLVRSKIEVFQDSIPAASKVVDSLVILGDCGELQKILLQILRGFTRIMEKQFHILRVLGMSEFIGIDMPLYETIANSPTNEGLDVFINHIYNKIVDRIEIQVVNNGFIAFFDIDKMKRTYAAHLIPKILHRRQVEFKEVCIHQDHNDIIDLTPLWMTSFGYSILSALKMGHSIEAKEFDQIEQALKQVNLKVCISMDSARESVNLSDELREFVLSTPI
jgi:hypothetical protein